MSKIKIAIQGELGAYSHIAVQKLYQDAEMAAKGRGAGRQGDIVQCKTYTIYIYNINYILYTILYTI